MIIASHYYETEKLCDVPSTSYRLGKLVIQPESKVLKTRRHDGATPS